MGREGIGKASPAHGHRGLLDQVSGRIRDPGIGRRSGKSAQVEGLALSRGVVIDGHDHDLPRGGTVVGGDGDTRRGNLGGADAHEAGPDELAEVALGKKALGGNRRVGIVIESLVVGVQVEDPPKVISVEIVVDDAVVYLVGVLQAAGDAGVVVGEVRYFSLPTFDGVSRRRGVAGRNGVWPPAVEMRADDFHVLRRVRVAHGGGGQVQIVREGLRHHDDVGESCGLERRSQVGPDVGVELGRRPEAGLVVRVVVGFVLDGNRVGREAVGVLHGRHKARLIVGVGLVIRGVELVGVGARVAAVVAGIVAAGVVVVLPLCRRAP